MYYLTQKHLFFVSLYRKLDCFKRQMARSDPLILLRIVARRIQKRKRAQTIPKDVLRLAKNHTARDNYMVGVFSYESYNYDLWILYDRHEF